MIHNMILIHAALLLLTEIATLLEISLLKALVPWNHLGAYTWRWEILSMRDVFYSWHPIHHILTLSILKPSLHLPIALILL